MTRDDYLAKADEADAMSELVSLGVDKPRFRIVAEEWRAKAASIEPIDVKPTPTTGRRDWFSMARIRAGFLAK